MMMERKNSFLQAYRRLGYFAAPVYHGWCAIWRSGWGNPLPTIPVLEALRARQGLPVLDGTRCIVSGALAKRLAP